MLLNVGISKGDEITAGLIKMRAVSGDEVHILDIYVEELREKGKDQRKWILKARNMLISLLDKKTVFSWSSLPKSDFRGISRILQMSKR